MREIKFRAWDKDYKEMLDNIIVYQGEVYKNTMPVAVQPLNAELMQYTGLKDKNGKEIYEGYILKLWGGKSRTGELRREYAYPLLVEYCTEWCQFVVTDKLNKEQYGIWETFMGYEVIGNIYENPELLSKEGYK